MEVGNSSLICCGRVSPHPTPIADHISTSKTYSQQRDYRFDMKTFTELKNAQSITLAYDGLNPLPPMFCYLKPYLNDVNKSYFRQLADGQL